jgi:hypothetical protein
MQTATVPEGVDFALSLQGRVCRYSSYERVGDEWIDITTPENGSSLSYGDLKEEFDYQGKLKTADIDSSWFFLSSYMSGSDYSGNDLEVSNHRVFLEMFGSVDGVHDVYGGYGTFAVAIRLSTLADNEEIRECLSALENYPVIDEDDMSEVEQEAQNEAWKSWLASDFAKALRQKFDNKKNGLNLEDIESESNEMRSLFYEAAEHANEYFINETGNSAWIDIEKIIKEVTEEDLASLPGVSYRIDTEHLIEIKPLRPCKFTLCMSFA